MRILDKKELGRVFNWDEYFAFHQELDEQKKTTGPNQSDEMIHYTTLNFQRSKRIRKQFAVDDASQIEISKLNPQQWILITEPWCGDAAQSVPIIAAIADLNQHIKLSIVLRDENLELMDEFLTNGGRAIPKLIMLNPETKEVIGSWGPRPKLLQEKFIEMKNNKIDSSEMKTYLQKWYNYDKGKSVLSEVLTKASEVDLAKI